MPSKAKPVKPAAPPDAPAIDADATTPEPEQPTGTDLTIRDPGDTTGVLAVLDKHDEAMIVEELQRRTLRVMLYSFPMDGSDVTDLSYLGVNEAIRVMDNEYAQRVTIARDSLTVESVLEDIGAGPEPCWIATVYAVNERTGYGQWATSIQAKRMKLRDASSAKRARAKDRHVYEVERGDGDRARTAFYVADQFARQKAINKAQRNALRVHIPEAIRQTLIAQYEGDASRIKRIAVGAGAEAMAALPPPLTDDEAMGLKQQARDVFVRIREADPLAMLPAVFHGHLIRAESDHGRLRDLVAALEQKLEEVTATVDASDTDIAAGDDD